MTIINVGPGQRFARLGAVSPKPQPGDEVVLHPGTVEFNSSTDTVQDWRGTTAKPILVRQADARNPAIYKRTIQAMGCQYVTFEGLVFDEPRNNNKPLACFVIDGNSSKCVTVRDISTTGGTVGFQVNQNGGKGHLLEGGSILNTLTITERTGGNGIGISNTTGTGWEPENRCVTIRGVTITNAVCHGMELQGKYGVVEDCTVTGAGREILGCSGIHVLNSGRLNAGPGSVPDEGTYWRIIGNDCNGTVTPEDTLNQGWIYQQDGNGIQADHECRFIEITGNVCEGNDGAGIAIFDAADVQVYNNTCKNNSLDAAGNHLHRGEIMVGYDENVTPAFLNNIAVAGNDCTMMAPRETNNWASDPPIGPRVKLYPHVWQVTYMSEPVKDRVGWLDNVLTVGNEGNPNILRWGETLFTNLRDWENTVPKCDPAPDTGNPPDPGTEPPIDERPPLEICQEQVAELTKEVERLTGLLNEQKANGG
jgi:parallel beta-helix repeat protein